MSTAPPKKQSHLNRRRTAAAVALAALAATTAIGAASAAPADVSSAEALAGADASVLSKNQVVQTRGPVKVFVEFDLPSTNDVKLARSGGGSANAVTAIESSAEEAAAESDGEILYTTVNTVPGVALDVDAAELEALAARDDVVSIKPIVLKERTSNSGSNAFTATTAAWEKYGATGEGQTIAVIDSGVDFGHATFNANNEWGPYPDSYAGNEEYFTATPTWPQGKVVGGWDFVGHAYHGQAGTPAAAPDGNPMDEGENVCVGIDPNIQRSGGHGTHVAGTAAGWGVQADGTTYEGAYTGVDPEVFDAFDVGPGSAPQAEVVALKVFGCAGSTAYVGPALDWLADPDNPIAASVDVVNLSVGSTFSTVDDPENAIVDKLVAMGKVVVISSGNSADNFDVGGSPGNANSALTVANSVGDSFQLDAAEVRVGTIDGEAQVLAGQYSQAYTFPAGTPVGPQEMVTLQDGTTVAYNSGCSVYTAADMARVAGKTVVVAWNDNAALPCGSAARANNAAAAGAAGIVFTGVSEVFAAGLTGNALIPTFQFTGPGTETLFDYAPATGVISIKEPTWISYDNTLGVSVTAPSVADSLNDSSSRGVHGSYGISKPDVAAPGTTISSAGVGTGNGTAVMSGTSMAAPHTAGIAAIVSGAHPDYSAPQVKAAVMNTANHDVWIENDGTQIFGPQRVGSGRVDGAAAVGTSVLAYAKDNPAGVQAVFGVLEVTDPVTRTIPVTVENHGGEAVSLGAAYTPQTTVPGVAFSLDSDTVSVPAGGSADVTITMTIANPAELAKTMDPSMFADQGLGVDREYLSVAQGWLEFTGAPSVEGALRVPVSAAPKPSAQLTAVLSTDAEPFVSIGDASAADNILLGGTGVDQDGYVSAVAPFQVGALSERMPGESGGIAAADIRAVGTQVYDYGAAAEGGIAFGVATWGPWATLGGSNQIWIEVENGTPGSPYQIGTQKFRSGNDFYDTTIVGVWNKAGVNVGLEFLNDMFGDVDTNSFDSAAAVLPVELEALGYPVGTKASDVSFTYSVYGTSWLAEDTNGDVEVIEDVPFNGATHATLGNAEGPLFVGVGGQTIPVENVADGAQLMVLSLHNGVGSQVLGLGDETVVTPIAPTQEGPTVTIPVVEGVEYLVDGVVVTGPIELADGESVTVTARALPGYVIAEGAVTEWSFTYSVEPSPTPTEPSPTTTSPSPTGTTSTTPSASPSSSPTSGGGLGDTGAPVMGAIAVAAVLLVSGAAFLVIRRRSMA